MPLVTEIKRDGETLKLKWDYRHLSAMYTAAIKEASPDTEYAEGKTFGDIPEGKWVDFSMVPIYYLDTPNVPLVTEGRQKLHFAHKFDFGFELKPGDILKAHREMK